MKLTGKCSCGAVTFTAEGEPKWQGYCHCRSCQTAHSAPMLAGAIFSAEDFTHSGEVTQFTVTQGERATTRFACSHCGTRVFNAPVPPVRTVFVALCDDRSAFAPQTHLWWSERLLDVADDLPKFLDFPKQFGGTGQLA